MALKQILLLVIINLLSGCISYNMTCPDGVCSCMVKNGNSSSPSYVSQCSNSSLSSIPEGLDRNTTVLNVSHNNITHLGNGSRSKEGVLHIDRVFYKAGRTVENEDGILKSLSSLAELHLESNLLASIAPGALDGNRKLMILNLRNNNLSSLPVDIITLKNNIHEVDIGGNAIETIDLATVQKYYPAIKRLDVSRNKITYLVSTSPIDNSSIEILDASVNYIVHLNRTFSNYTKLKELNISNNHIRELSSDVFSNNPDLVKVDISRNHILVVDRNAFRNNMKITEVNAGSNKMTFLHPDTFSKNHHLTKVTVSWNNIEEIHPETFYNNENLETVDFSSNRIKTLNPSLFENNPKLKSVDLRSNSLLTVHRNTFQNNPQLEHLLLSKNEHVRFHDGFVIHSTVLKVFDVQHCNLSHLPPGVLNQTNNLKELNLANNNLSSLENVTDVENNGYENMLTKLEVLDLSNNKLKRINVEVFSNNMTNLKDLRIAGNSFLCDCKLRSLWLWSQKVGIIPSEPQITCKMGQNDVPWEHVQNLNCSDESLLDAMKNDSSEINKDDAGYPYMSWYPGREGGPKEFGDISEDSSSSTDRSNKIMLGVSLFILLAVVLVILPLLFIMRRRYGTYKVSKPKNGGTANETRGEHRSQPNGSSTA